jgi:hypothetical protein
MATQLVQGSSLVVGYHLNMGTQGFIVIYQKTQVWYKDTNWTILKETVSGLVKELTSSIKSMV